jgi:glucan phosphoethanolaminetransferase (alkaline phosphatase superfamily)
MNLEKNLDRIHACTIKNVWLQRFTAFTRILLAIGFIPPSLVKIAHRPFTVLPDSNPVGHYFTALYATGFYYEFLGWAQLTAAILLLFPRTAHIGALMFLPIIVNLAVLTTSVGFVGTWLITILMSMAATYLVCWEYDRLKPILFYKRAEKAKFFNLEFVWLPILFALAGAAIACLWAFIRLGNFHNYLFVGLVLSSSGFAFGLIVAAHHKFMRVGAFKNLGV